MSDKEVEEKIDFLEVDDPIGGQQFVCLSFVSPEDVIQNKEAFKTAKFLQSYAKDKGMKFDEVYEDYLGFQYKFQDEIQRDFDNENKGQTNIRGVKVRGVYSSKEEAESRAKKLHRIDSSFHVFIGQVGYWLPWNPCADKIEDEKFEKGTHDYLDRLDWSATGFTKIQSDNEKYRFAYLRSFLLTQPKKLDEAKGLYISAYQDYLEKEWLQSLKDKYKVEVFREVLQ